MATITDVELLWRQLCEAATLHEILAERGNKLERLQIIRDGQTVEILRVWRGIGNALEVQS